LLATPAVYEIVSRAAWELGLSTTGLADPSNLPFDPYASTDPNILMLLALMNNVGQDLARDYEWRFQRIEASLNLAAPLSVDDDGALFQIPSDLDHFIPETMWNRDTLLPLIGPLSPQQWQAMKAQSQGANTQQYWRITSTLAAGDRINIFITSAVSQTVKFEYATRYWLYAVSNGQLALDEAVNAYDLCAFDGRLMVAGVKLYWRKQKGYDTSAAQDDFDRALEREQSKSEPGHTTSLSGGRELPLGWPVTPDTGFGS
jgi:hypothetical protein